MLSHIDWYSFTVPLQEVPTQSFCASMARVLNEVEVFTNGIFSKAYSSATWSVAKGQRFYGVRYFSEGQGTSVSVGTINSHVLCEMSGLGCEYLSGQGLLYDLIKCTAHRATRIDLAVDMETEASPNEFVAASDCERFKSRGSYQSETGTTEYIGSRTSERMARVYRYSPPHPRSHLLRAECEYKGDAARAIAAHLDGRSLISKTLSAHLPFGWKHPAWQPEMIDVQPVKLGRMDKEAARTLMWLFNAVMPSLKRCEREGIISFDEFVDRYKKYIEEQGE